MRRCCAVLLVLVLGLATAVEAQAAAGGGWTAYDLSGQNANIGSTGVPSLIVDNVQNAFVNDSGDIVQFYGDGADGARAFNITALAGAPSNSGSPATIIDPAVGGVLIFSVAGADIEEYYDSSSNQWHAGSIALPDSLTASGSPSALTPASGHLTVAVLASDGHLVVEDRDPQGFAWAGTDVTADTGEPLATDPATIVDPADGDADVFGVNDAGHLLQFSEGSSWTASDVSAAAGGVTVTSAPTALVDAGSLDVFAVNGSGHLIEFSRNPGGGWSSQDLTSLSGGPALSGAPAAVADPLGGVAVFGGSAGNGRDLVEYDGSGTSWSAADLSTADGAPQLDGAPAATVSASTQLLSVFYSSTGGHLLEVERTSAPATGSGSGAMGSGSTGRTVVSGPPPPKAAVGRVKVRVLTDWTWSVRDSELHWIKLGKVVSREGLSLRCRGRGCPFRSRSAVGPRAVANLVARLERSRYRVSEVLTLTVSEPGRRPEVASFHIRSRRAPSVTG